MPYGKHSTSVSYRHMLSNFTIFHIVIQNRGSAVFVLFLGVEIRWLRVRMVLHNAQGLSCHVLHVLLRKSNPNPREIKPCKHSFLSHSDHIYRIKISNENYILFWKQNTHSKDSLVPIAAPRWREIIYINTQQEYSKDQVSQKHLIQC